MRFLAWLLVCLLLVVISVPFAGPWLGLTRYEELIEPPGISIQVPAGALNVHLHDNAGRDIVLVHGHPGSAQMMRPLAAALHRHGYRVTRYDRLGWGHSAQRSAAQPANPTAHAEDLLALARQTLTNPLFVGYSYGGGVVMEANRQAPYAVRDMVLLSSVGRRTTAPAAAPDMLTRVINSPLFKRWAFGTDYTMQAAADAISQQLMFPEPAPAAFRGFLASLSLDGVPTNWARESRERFVGFEDYQPGAVQGCVLVLHGEADQVIDVSVAQASAELIAEARLRVVEGAGHGMVLTQPAALAGFIAAHDQACSAEPDIAPVRS